jgi:serine/threonine-protein kinase
MRPTKLGRWDVLAKIAGGGISAIYLGRAPDSEDRVALKIVKPELRGNEQVDHMFVDEASLLVKLVHPHIVRTYDFGDDPQHGRYIAMELLLGKTMAAVHDACAQRGGRLAPEAVAWVGARVADALHYAHELVDEERGQLAIIHRDVNPANLFLTFDGEVKLFDFGMARATGRATKSSPGIVKGTLPYLSPEQVMQLPIDRRTDVFGLGTTLWELATGRRLFKRDNDAETVRAVQFATIPDPRSIAPEIPEALVNVLKKALERNRSHRYATAAALRDDLDAFASTRHPEKAPGRLSKLLDELFPGERKRQMGWLKPVVGGGSIPPPPPKR